MMHSMKYFPIVPRNVPPDDLAKYLAMYDAQAEALAASYGAAVHAEWDINVPAPVMRDLRGLEGPILLPLSTTRPDRRAAPDANALVTQIGCGVSDDQVRASFNFRRSWWMAGWGWKSYYGWRLPAEAGVWPDLNVVLALYHARCRRSTPAPVYSASPFRGLGTEPDGSATIGECGTLSEWARGNGVAPTVIGAADSRVWCYTSATPQVQGGGVAYLFTVRGSTETRTVLSTSILRSPARAVGGGAGAGLAILAAALGAWYLFRG